MTLRRLITLPLAMLIIAGLAFAPLVTPASAMALGKMGGVHGMSHANVLHTDDMQAMDSMSDDAAPDMMAMHDMGAMNDSSMHDMNAMSGMEPIAADMPCCPNDKKNDGCPDCPLMTICALKTAQAHPSMDGVLLLRSPMRTIQSARDDAPLAGLDHPPPDHPPRHLI
jgi:hypothetical protein